MKILLAVLVSVSIIAPPIIVGKTVGNSEGYIVRCELKIYRCEWDSSWGEDGDGANMLCPIDDHCGGEPEKGCTCSTKVFGS